MAVLFQTKKCNTTGTNFELELVCFFNKPSPNFIENQNVCIKTGYALSKQEL